MTYQDMEFFIQQNIFRLEISVDDTTLVHVFDSGHQLGRIEPRVQFCCVGGLVIRGQAIDQSK